MVLKTKLSLGIGFLFVIIFALAGFCSYYIQKLSRESDNILKDNYHSLVYAKNMLQALDDMNTAVGNSIFNPASTNKASDYYIKTFESARNAFDGNLKEENGNITEIQEKDYVDQLNTTYALYLNLSLQMKNGAGSTAVYFSELLPAYEKLRRTISAINDVNMQAIVRKNELAQRDAGRIIDTMGIIVTISVLLAMGYFWYFPFYVSNSISYLSGKMRRLLEVAGITLDIQSDDETHIILQSINLLENKFSAKGKDAQ
jgi:two-component system, NtrC family, sensor histidine kinase KinB